MRPGTVAEMSIERQGWSGPLMPDWHHTYYTYTDFAGFMAQLTPRFPGRPDEYARIARECLEDLAAQNVVYAEVSFDAPVREVGDDSRFWPIVEALEGARRAAEKDDLIRVGYIVGLMRTLPPQVASYRVQLAARARDRGIGIVGIDLHGDETAAPATPFAPAFALAKHHGLGLRAHAGEVASHNQSAAGPHSIVAALDDLHVTRIAHGIRAIDDPLLMRRLRDDAITLEVCPTSNVRTGVVPSIAAHPIRQLYDSAIRVTINSDDPLPFFTGIERECRLLVDELGFDKGDLLRMTLNAADAAFLPHAERQALLQRIEAAYHGEDASQVDGSSQPESEALPSLTEEGKYA